MSLPLIILAAVSCVAGFIPFGEFVTWNRAPYHIHIDWVGVAIPSLCVATCAIALAAWLFAKKNDKPAKMKAALPALWQAANRRFYWDEIYMFVTHKIIFNGICRGIAWFDRHIIDGTMDAMASITQYCSLKIKGMQSGSVQTYVIWYFLGALLLAAITWICLL